MLLLFWGKWDWGRSGWGGKRLEELKLYTVTAWLYMMGSEISYVAYWMWAGKSCPLGEVKHFGCWNITESATPAANFPNQQSETRMANQKKALCNTWGAGNLFCLFCTFVVTRFYPNYLIWNSSPQQVANPTHPRTCLQTSTRATALTPFIGSVAWL